MRLLKSDVLQTYKSLQRYCMSSEKNMCLDNWGKGLLIGIISRAINADKSLNNDDIEKLKEIKKQLQQTGNGINVIL